MSEKITKDEFLEGLKDFKKLKRNRRKEIFDLAWQAKNFEIELYWKRAGYFWAFQALVFAGFFAIASSSFESEKKYYLHYTICLGFVTALAWHLSNKGSKVWQRHWEKIVDVLEDYVIGKLYKTNTAEKTFSVSKINELISKFFWMLWLFLLIKSTFFDNQIILIEDKQFCIDWRIFVSNLLACYIIYQMYYGKGRGRFGEREIQFYRRKIKVN